MGASIAVITCAGGGEFRGKGVWPSLYAVAVSWLRLQTPKDCIPHPYWMYRLGVACPFLMLKAFF